MYGLKPVPFNDSNAIPLGQWQLALSVAETRL
jgi:hypothetical protein